MKPFKFRKKVDSSWLLPLISVILTTVHLQAVLVLVLLPTILTFYGGSSHVLAYDVSLQVIFLGAGLATPLNIMTFFQLTLNHILFCKVPATSVGINSIMNDERSNGFIIICKEP